MTGTSLIATMAAERGMDPVQFARTIRATVMPSDHTEEQFAAFMLVAHKYGLDPITKEIYAYPARKGGGINPVLSVDGWINLVNSHPQADGFEFDYGYDREGKLASCTCSMWRKDRSHPIRVTEHLVECYRNTEPWNQMPKRMLRHKAFKECARLAFGFAGVYDEDEARDVIAAVEDLQQPIDTINARSALDAFAAEDATVIEQEHLGTVSLDDSPSQSSEGSSGKATTPSISPSAPAAAAFHKSVELGDQKAEAIDTLLAIASDTEVGEDGRMADINKQWPRYQKQFEESAPDFLAQLFGNAEKVARGELKADGARRYLKGLSMKLAQFTSGSGKISVNPQHVVTVRPADAKDKAVIFLATGGQITVDGTVNEVTDKLATALSMVLRSDPIAYPPRGLSREKAARYGR